MHRTFSELTQPIKGCVLSSIRIRLQLLFVVFFHQSVVSRFLLSGQMFCISSLFWTIPEHSVRPWDGQSAMGIVVGHTARTRVGFLKKYNRQNPEYLATCDGNKREGRDWQLGFGGAWHACRCRVQQSC
jgi:hypothetical protein